VTVVWGQFEHLLKVCEGLVDVVLVIETEPAYVHGVGATRFRPYQVRGYFLRLPVATKEHKTLSSKDFKSATSGR